MAGAQTQPKELPWAAGELQGGGEWSVRLPQLLIRDWPALSVHKTTDQEKAALRLSFFDDAVKALDVQASQAALAFDKAKLKGALPSTEPEATRKALLNIESQRGRLLDGSAPGLVAPSTLTLKPAWAPNRELLPWPAGDRAELLSKSKALYVVTGTLRDVGGYLSVHIELFSDIEKKVLSVWDAQFAPDEAPASMLAAAGQFRSVLTGKPWAGLNVSSPVLGAEVLVGAQWHTLPWTSADLDPGTVELRFRYPGGRTVTQSLQLEAGVVRDLPLEAPENAQEPLVLQTDPPGIALYLDSRYLGLSPQTVDRPLTTSRVRAQGPGWATAAWEIGPATPSPSVRTMTLPVSAPSVPAAKDNFYLSLATFSFSLTSTAFLGAWWDEQVKLTNAYALAGAEEGYQAARQRFEWSRAGYGASIVLTSAVFVWMMFELGDYLGAAQASLP